MSKQKETITRVVDGDMPLKKVKLGQLKLRNRSEI